MKVGRSMPAFWHLADIRDLANEVCYRGDANIAAAQAGVRK
jgi:hypothetical protein